MDADGVLDRLRAAGAVDEVGVHVVNGAFAVTAETQTIGHVSATIFAEIEGVLALMRVLGVAVWHDHFGQRQTVEDWTDIALVVEGDVVQHDTFLVVEADVQVPLLPRDLAASHLE